MKHLKNVLLLNAASSGITALLLIILPGFFADLFGVKQQFPFIGIGIFLFLFAFFVFIQSRKKPLNPKKVQLIIVMDISWVLGSLVIILPQLFSLSLIGYVLIGGVALWVAAMAALQSIGLKKVISN